MKQLFNAAALLLVLLSSGPALAQLDVPQCRPALGLGEEIVQRDIWVIVDRTTALPKPLQEGALLKLRRALRPGDRVQVLAFSSLQGDEFTQRTLNALISSPMTESERYELPKRTVSRLEQCLREQERRVHGAIQSQVSQLLGNPLSNAANSDILLALSDISQQLIAPSPAGHRLVLLVSDMLEHSSITSFYSRQTLRQIDPSSELAKVEEAGLVGNFDRTDIYVLGAGSLPGRVGGYRSQPELLALKIFWESFFSRSGGQIKGWGQPELLMELPR